MAIELTNLNKYISSSGFCSRREADKLIEQARVTVNGELVLPGARITPGDIVEVDGEPIKKTAKKRPVYIAFNKPVGVTSTTDVKDKLNIIYFINYPKRIFPVGRLDKDSSGLIFLTNDGDIVNKILRASNNHEKEYTVTVDKAITPDFIKQMSAGVPVEGKMTKTCFVRQEGGRRFRNHSTQGLNRQIRRMCEYLGFKVVELTRVRIMNIDVANLLPGKWRYFTLPEIEKLNQMVAESSKTDTGNKEKGPARAKVQYIPKRSKAAGEGRDTDATNEKGKRLTGVRDNKTTGAKSKKAAAEPGKSARSPKPISERGNKAAKTERQPKIMGEKGKVSKAGKFKDFREKKGRSTK